ncbi:hypothetical protein OIDMADRAFT_149871 [Oidiodendron maius Zn]|uniref:CCHC-type domain-containing protein n=1 Tax=Oidiodendron maius (strain Zn) TaxID=913774 RepID=A0A0C3GRC2_OIDMZ|nr:hypothetical protein OIDMADRAFT_149871 [Oidiodendron maius Zn]
MGMPKLSDGSRAMVAAEVSRWNVSSIGEIELDDEASQRCKVCHSLGHTSFSPHCLGYDQGKPCYNCGQFGHLHADCLDPRIVQLPPPKNGCRRCGGAHRPAECQLPWCNKCKTTAHAGSSCPNILCHRCKEQGHRADACPQRPPCAKCGSKAHTTNKCSVTFNRQYALTRQDDLAAAELLRIETKFHKQQFPEEHIDDDFFTRDAAADDHATKYPDTLHGWGTTDSAEPVNRW